MRESFKVSAPGKLLLLGEHAVLYGRPCLVCAVNQRMSVHLAPRNDSKILVHSEIGFYQGKLPDFEIDPRFRFVLTAIKEYYNGPFGFDLKITSDFSHNVGLGSSAAVTAATLGAVGILQNNQVDENILFDQGLSVIRQVQGKGSGADLAASVFGGILSYRTEPREIKKIAGTFPISVVYSGEKTPTTKVIQIVEENRNKNRDWFDRIYDLMEMSVEKASEAITNFDWKRVGEIFNINQGLMDAIGVNTPVLADINYRLRQDKSILGSKISGSGLGDCVVGLGTVRGNLFSVGENCKIVVLDGIGGADCGLRDLCKHRI